MEIFSYLANTQVSSIEMFGQAAPGNVVLEKYGFTGDNIYKTAKRVLGKISEGKVNKV